MTRFLVLYHAPKSALEAMANISTDDMKKGMEPWMAWAARCGESLVDMGAPLRGGRRVAGWGVTASDSDVVGYSMLEAENMEAAETLLEDHPHLDWMEGCEIEVHEAVPLPM